MMAITCPPKDRWFSIRFNGGRSVPNVGRRERQIGRVIIDRFVDTWWTDWDGVSVLYKYQVLSLWILDTIFTMAEFPQDFQQWKDSTLLDLNKRFLRGEISSSPYHYGPIEEETHSLVLSLLKLHESQFLTWSSLPYLHECKRRDGREFTTTDNDVSSPLLWPRKLIRRDSFKNWKLKWYLSLRTKKLPRLKLPYQDRWPKKNCYIRNTNSREFMSDEKLLLLLIFKREHTVSVIVLTETLPLSINELGLWS